MISGVKYTPSILTDFAAMLVVRVVGTKQHIALGAGKVLDVILVAYRSDAVYNPYSPHAVM